MSALESLKKFGLHFSKPETDQVRLPSDITVLSSEQLAETFTQLTAWADYIASQLAVAQIEERQAMKQLEFLENKMMVTRMGAAVKGERVTLVKAQIAVNQDVVDASNLYEEKYAYRKLVEMLLHNHERDLQLVSREITRRTNDQRANRKDYGF